MELVTGIDGGLRSGGIVSIDAADHDRVLIAFQLSEGSGAVKAATAAARALLERQFACENPQLAFAWGDVEYTSASLRADAWIARATAALDEIVERFGTVGFVAVESFVDQRSRAREEKARLIAKRWQTPHVNGRLEALLAARYGVTVAGGRLLYQNAGTVLKQYSTERALIEDDWAKPARHDGLISPGDALICDEHTRSAYIHALALAFRLRKARRFAASSLPTDHEKAGCSQ